MRFDFRAHSPNDDRHHKSGPWSVHERATELARLVPLWPSEIADTSRAGRVRLVAKLYRALKAERRRGVGGHWSYDLARHAALLAAWRRERAALGLRDAAIQSDAPKPQRKTAPARSADARSSLRG